ncbi:uncharacterized protein PHACADRAFT_212279 [Phanerochaete carnosa HHB-10118-sp]|uniref:Oxidoreductase AflY n=1 Tax=Phanerochaete carnosa (strain HHB-10118-sp) TaxID=650164 RepID=K5VJV5_PHACS|nr:uncharacterized protein PHACADRAFT_212279 [Phanerochaete carnosa HHB-10118-sp]EKM51648.1 hypothetical protein PHACADRAFT_212279 [Phanerochaete carnosa HHB-10118-sp]
MDASPEQLNARFPKLALVSPSIVSSPTRLAGWTHESTQAVLECLKDNHQRFHIFFQDGGLHNHASHHLLAIYTMGASAEVIREAYQTHVAYQRPAKDHFIAATIDEKNWKEHVGNEKYYQAYVSFFSRLLLSPQSKGLQAILEEYVFSTDANLVAGKNGVKPYMLGRFYSSLFHPLIHTGYGVEFGLPGLAVEGLAQTAVHTLDIEEIFTPEFFNVGSADTLASRLSSLVVSAAGVVGSSAPSADVHALSILSRIEKDIDFAPENLDFTGLAGLAPRYSVVLGRADNKLLKYSEEWTETVVPDRDVLKRKFEELVWMNTVIYGVGGWAGRALGEDEKGKFNGDFLFMHGVTSSLMTASVLNTLSLNSAVLLLRAYFVFFLLTYTIRGRPALPIKDFYANTSLYPSPPGTQPAAAKDTLVPSAAPNPWLPIVQTTLVHPDEHLCKTQRSLMHFAECYGGTEPGAFAHTDLQGAEMLDGTLFARVAALTADRLGWMREGETQRGWDRNGFAQGLKHKV